jgi:hypothetical protein
MKLRLATAVAVALTAVLIPSPANATGTGYFDPVPTVTMVDGCINVPFTVHLFLTNNNGWSLETRVLYPNGTPFDLRLASGPATDEVHGQYQMAFCHPKEPPGVYTIQGTLNTVDLDASQHTVSLPPITFQVISPPPPPALPAIVNTQLPQISGAIAPQVGYPMSLSNGSWTPSNVGVSAQWLAGGQPIPGAFYGEYKPTLADLGKTLTVRVTASLPGYVSATATTLPTLPVSKQVQNNLRPWLKGTANVGERLKVKPGVWRPLFVVKFKYRWYTDGHRIRSARDDRLQLTPALEGTKIVCRVTGSAPGLDPLQVRTPASAKVKK